MDLKLIFHEICKIPMAKELEQSKLKVMKFDNKLKQEQKNLEEAESEILKYKSQMGKKLEHQSLSQEYNE